MLNTMSSSRSSLMVMVGRSFRVISVMTFLMRPLFFQRVQVHFDHEQDFPAAWPFSRVSMLLLYIQLYYKLYAIMSNL